jgi:hypothetical protein
MLRFRRRLEAQSARPFRQILAQFLVAHALEFARFAMLGALNANAGQYRNLFECPVSKYPEFPHPLSTQGQTHIFLLAGETLFTRRNALTPTVPSTRRAAVFYLYGPKNLSAVAWRLS